MATHISTLFDINNSGCLLRSIIASRINEIIKSMLLLTGNLKACN